MKNKLFILICILICQIFFVFAQKEITESETIQITDATITDIKTSSAIIRWITNIDSDSTVNYGEDIHLGTEEYGAELTKIHEITLIGLLPASDYYFNVTSCDADGNCATSGLYAFITSQVVEEEAVEEEQDQIQDVIEDVAQEQGISQSAVQSVQEEAQQTITNNKRKGSAIVTTYGIYATYKEGIQKKLLARTSTSKRVKSWFVKLVSTQGNTIKLVINGQEYTLNLSKTIKVDMDNDDIADLQIRFHSIPYESAATLFIKGIHVAIEKDTINYRPEEVFDVDKDMVTDVLIDKIDITKEIPVESVKKKSNLLPLLLIIGIIVVVGIIAYFNKKK